MNLNSNILKITGSAEIEAPLEIGKRYAVGMEIGITDERKVDNEDGTFDVEFKGKMIRAQVKKENGEIIKTKDNTAQSVKTRMAILAVKSEFRPEMDDDSFYNLVQGGIRHDLREVVRRILATG
jgi:hypothetical protein